ncbi:uncharacterized protein LOC119580748 [Penaeus monodon]|uniref:uncharacterized protein LOC119580748 n=1 Tax=Penaeus monodon TaxID=6687 RepID=UPI0018A70C19|nr:uncharacterized protein LOC119580748 [Penaeus monodon]
MTAMWLQVAGQQDFQYSSPLLRLLSFLFVSHFETLLRQAEALGLSGDALSDYVSKQQNIYREERAKERELQKLQIEAENQKARLAHELEMTKIRANNDASITPVFGDDIVRPSLPVFHDSEDISLYLIRFERVADLLNLKKESYAVRLGSLLTGKAVYVYTSLSPEITKDYGLLKKCLLDSFAKTPDSYKVDFRSAKIKPDISMFLKENNVSTLDETARFADTWASAHGSYPKSNTGLHRDDNSPRKFLTSGTINGSWVSAILRDSGCSCVIVAEQLLPDVDLTSCVRCKANAGETENMRDGSVFKYEVMNGLIYRSCVNSRFCERVGKTSLVVPADCRKIILSLAHESPLAGHFSHRKTEIKVREQFYWPGMGADIKDYCRSCEKCQRMSSKGRIKPAPLQPIPIVTEPFSRVAIDIVGPLTPASSQGHKYILTLIDFATRFPDAIPLKDIDSVSVAEALLMIFSRVGIPREILSDRGTQFTSKLMGELHKLLGIKPLFTTPYHPSCNGRIERFHSTLKACLRKLCVEKPKEWHRYLIPTLFALREIPSDRTAFSPFELLYGRTVWGPLSVLRDLWKNSSVNEDQRSTYQYIIELKDKLADCAKIAARNADISSSRYRSYFDLKSQKRHFKKGDEVLVLLPDHANKLLMSWRAPFPVLEQKNKINYLIDENGTHKLYHVNLLKKYYRRSTISRTHALDEVTDVVNNVLEPFQTVHMCLVEDDSGGMDELPLTTDDIFSDIPGCTSLIKHNIELTSTEIIRAKRYPIPVHLHSHFREEVYKSYEQGIIRLSSSPYCSPVVMVKKDDGTYRMAIDFRAINSITVFHAEPSCTMEEELFKFAGARYFSEIDLTKAYYQIPLSESAMPLTSFPTHRGLMEFTRLPFGLVTAGATYIRLMRLVLSGLSNIAFYFDNIFIYVEYLGFIVNGQSLRPQYNKIEALLKVPLPKTKKALRKFLGMISFYRLFIPNVSNLTSPLSDMLRRNVREPFVWSNENENKFEQLKQYMTTKPILKLPDINIPFALRTDASNYGVGAVLLQYVDDDPYPVAYASRKLLERERRYSTVERECLAIVFGVTRFQYYLTGKEFILEVDHKPLIYINSAKSSNNRVVRWSLCLQSYRFRIVYIAGTYFCQGPERRGAFISPVSYPVLSRVWPKRSQRKQGKWN